MLASIEATAENIIFAPKIASAYIFNNNFEKALAWIELYENAKEVDQKSVYIRILLDLYSSSDLNSFINSTFFRAGWSSNLLLMSTAYKGKFKLIIDEIASWSLGPIPPLKKKGFVAG